MAAEGKIVMVANRNPVLAKNIRLQHLFKNIARMS
jgi:hypothetical protein